MESIEKQLNKKFKGKRTQYGIVRSITGGNDGKIWLYLENGDQFRIYAADLRDLDSEEKVFSDLMNGVKKLDIPREVKFQLEEFVYRMNSRMVDAELSNRGYMSCFETLRDTIAKKNKTITNLKFIIEEALATEEKHYEEDETVPGWISLAKPELDKLKA